MNRISPAKKETIREQFPQFGAVLDSLEKNQGVIPQNIMMMAHWPELTQAFFGIVKATETSKTISEELQNLVWFAAAQAHGCRYCQAHFSSRAANTGTAQEKIDAVWEFETHPIFTDAERAALTVAFKGGSSPNAVEDEDFDELKKHYSERECIEIVAFISLAGFLNRWNDTLASTLEAMGMEYAQEHLTEHGWDGSKHAEK